LARSHMCSVARGLGRTCARSHVGSVAHAPSPPDAAHALGRTLAPPPNLLLPARVRPQVPVLPVRL
jgi:hypothetical protein